MKKRLLNIALVLGLVTGLVAGAIAPAGAAGPEFPGESSIYFPWVPNNDTIAGIEGMNGSVTVQNVEILPVDVTLTDAAGQELTTITLNPRASQTWTADELGLDEPGSGVIASAEWTDLNDLIGVDLCWDYTQQFTRGSQPGTADSMWLEVPFQQRRPHVINAVVIEQASFIFPSSSYTWQYNPGTLWLAIDWSPSGPEPIGGLQYTVTVIYDCPAPRIAGVEKHTVGTVGALTSSATEMIDGYTAVPQYDVALADDGGAILEGQSRWVLPIVQTNSGWNTEIFITNISGKNNAVSVTFYPAAGQGVAGPSKLILSGKALAVGATVRINLRDYGFPEGVVGSVWIDATHAVVAGAFRHKPATSMMLTTNAQPRHDAFSEDLDVDPTVKYGPLVFRDYNGWNTGINIANLSSYDNRVTVTYYNYQGNVVASEAVTIPPRAMEYVYTPATGNFGLGENQVTAVRIAGQYPLVAAIDEVKYLGGQGEGHAMSYPAAYSFEGLSVNNPNPIADTGRNFYDRALSLPLVQKGDPMTGTGDTSGINLFNASAEWDVEAWVQFLDASGVPVAPTVAGTDAEDPLVLPLAPHAGATVYTLTFSEMSDGFQGAAIVGVINVLAELVGVSNNVNYAVAGDGSAAFNLVNTYLWDYYERLWYG